MILLKTSGIGQLKSSRAGAYETVAACRIFVFECKHSMSLDFTLLRQALYVNRAPQIYCKVLEFMLIAIQVDLI